MTRKGRERERIEGRKDEKAQEKSGEIEDWGGKGEGWEGTKWAMRDRHKVQSKSQVARYIYEPYQLKVSKRNVVLLNVIHLLKVSSIWRTGLALNAHSLFQNSFSIYSECYAFRRQLGLFRLLSQGRHAFQQNGDPFAIYNDAV